MTTNKTPPTIYTSEDVCELRKEKVKDPNIEIIGILTKI